MLKNLKPYPTYKDSGKPWLGDVPAHWEVVSNRSVFAEIRERNHPNQAVQKRSSEPRYGVQFTICPKLLCPNSTSTLFQLEPELGCKGQ